MFPDFDDCSSSGSSGNRPKRFWERAIDVHRFLWNIGRFLVEGGAGFARKVAEWVWDKFLELLEIVRDAAGNAWGQVTEWAGSTWGRIVDWAGGLLGGGDDGGCCYCECNHCCDYCPDLFINDCTCTPTVEWDDPDMLECQARCVEGMMEDVTEPASAIGP